jgi:copper ion binding protein
MSQATFSVPSISCDHCVRTIRAALGEVAGVQHVDVDIDTKQVSVVYDSAAVSEIQMKVVLAAADYPVAVAETVQPEAMELAGAGASCGCCHI